VVFWRHSLHHSRMERHDIDEDLPILEFYLTETLEYFESIRTKAMRKVSRERLLTTFLRTRDIGETARICGVSQSTVRQILSKAIYAAKRIAGLWPPAKIRSDD
jgi:DNA-directed RNA polymerase specialized sigma subunit